MPIHTFFSREFTRDVSAAKRAAAEGPVFITDRGRPAFALLKIDDYHRRAVLCALGSMGCRLHLPGAFCRSQKSLHLFVRQCMCPTHAQTATPRLPPAHWSINSPSSPAMWRTLPILALN